jgi:hypothetical protein
MVEFECLITFSFQATDTVLEEPRRTALSNTAASACELFALRFQFRTPPSRTHCAVSVLLAFGSALA